MIEVPRLNDYPSLCSLMVMLTRACQLSCVYCSYDKRRPAMSRETLRRALDLLFRSENDIVRLQLFGGEPLLRPDLVDEAVDYAQKLSAKSGKKLRLTLTTNGFLLDEGVMDRLAGCGADYLLSFDGTDVTQMSQRPAAAASRPYPYESVLAAVRLLVRRGPEFFVNMVTPPEHASRAGENARFLMGLGVGRIRFSYQLGAIWTGAQAASYFASVHSAIKGERGLEVINPLCLDEPDIMTPTPKVDCDGAIHIGSVVPSLERALPRLVALTRVGDVRTTKEMNDLKRDRTVVWNSLRDAYPRRSKQGRAVDSSLRMGLLSDSFFRRLARGTPIELGVRA